MNKQAIFDFLRTVPKKIYFFLAGALAFAVLLILLFTLTPPATTKDEPTQDTPPTPTPSPVINETEDTQDPENTEYEFSGAPSKLPENNTQQTPVSHGIDVSKWQGTIDWEKAKNDGVEFAFIRVGYRGENGKLYMDDAAKYNLQEATRVGIKAGAYFFSTAVNEEEVLEEARFVLSVVRPYAISYPIVYDCEGFEKTSSRMFHLSVSQRCALARKFLDEVRAQGYETMFYSSVNALSTGLWNTADLGEDTLLWVAQYPSVPYPQTQKPSFEGAYAAWQYTDCGRIDGISANVDLVVCYFTRPYRAPHDDTTPEEVSPPKKTEELDFTPVNERVTAKIEVNLRTEPTTKADVVYTLKNGEVLTRDGILMNGWSRLNFNGQTVYAITSYLTTDTTQKKPDEDIVHNNTFTPVNDRVTAKIEVNLRALPTTDSEIVGKLVAGTFLERTATSDRGWSRLNFNGQTVYAVTSYLSAEYIPPQQEEPPISDGFVKTSEMVTAKQETNLRTAPSVTNSEIVYTLKHGEYVERTGTHTNGWSRLNYNGQTVYAITSYLTTESAEDVPADATAEKNE